jgi:hypothetical protein
MVVLVGDSNPRPPPCQFRDSSSTVSQEKAANCAQAQDLIGVGLPALRMQLHQLERAFWCMEAQGCGTKYVTISS